jgi:asparagine synthase (glutamine-hydrolysing)
MCTAIRHRGPDDEGIHTDGVCGIGMRRLSIIDLSTGHQPMSNEDGSIWVVFNGEIYNYQELRRDLIARGHRFQTNSDTETLVHLYEQEGLDGVTKLRGMFGYAIWDSNKGQLMVARDRFGKKPIYWAETAEGFFFGSEVKCLRAAGLKLEPDQEAIKLYLQLGYVPDPWSAFQGVHKLPPAHLLILDAAGRVRQQRYWKLPAPTESPDPGFSEAQICDQIRHTFDESVRMRMIADVPLGGFLSGGIDSSLVVSSMARQSGRPVKTFSIGFEEQEYNELPYARMIAGQYATEHHERILRPDAVDLATRLIHYFDEPFADSSAIPTFLVSEFAVQHVKVVLSGDGGDELFGGYWSHWEADRERRMDRIPMVLRRAVGSVARLLPYSAKGKNFLWMASRPNGIERFFESINFSSYFLRQQVLDPAQLLPAHTEFLRRTFPDGLLADSADCLSQALYFEATAKLAGDILVKVDRMSMANSLEVRCPLLDHKLAELSARIPNGWKTRDGQGKLILLKALGERLKPEVIHRPKRGFSIPLAEWFRGPLRELLWDQLRSRQFLSRGLVSGPMVERMLTEHDSRRRDNYPFLWLLLVLELWYQGLHAPAGESQLAPRG